MRLMPTAIPGTFSSLITTVASFGVDIRRAARPVREFTARQEILDSPSLVKNLNKAACTNFD
jgi:hypothetical protein